MVAQPPVIDGIFKSVSKFFETIYEKCWKEPASIRGSLWAALWWVRVIAGVVLLQPIVASGHLLTALVLIGAHVALQKINSKPVRLGRPLPYRRRR